MAVSDSNLLRYTVSGLGCGSCVNKLQKALTRIPGVRSASVDLDSATAVVDMAPTTPREELEAAADKLGYPMTAAP